MNFANPLLLAGLAAAVLPLVLHLIGRARARTVPWGATMLLDAAGHGRASGRWRDGALMLIRCLAIGLLALALARPVDPAAEPAAGGAGQAVVLVIDTSPSSAHPEGQTTRLELARWTALDRLGRLRQGDQAGVVVLGQAWNMDVAPTPDLQSVASQIASLAVGPLFGDLAEGERRARAMLADGGVENGEIDLIADRQRTAWEPLADAAAAGTAATANATVAGGPRVIAMPVGGTRTANIRVESIEPLEPPLVVGQPTRFAVRVRNDDDIPHGDLTLRLSIGTSEDGGPLAVDGRGVTRVVRTVTPTSPGPAVVMASVPPDGLPGDDTLRLAVDVLPRPRVSLLSATTVDLGPAFDVVAFSAESLLPGDVVVLNDVALDLANVAVLERHVAVGGSLVVAAGPSLPAGAWNTRLWKGGFGFAPAATADVKPANGPARLQLAPGASETVLDKVDGDPLAIERTFGRGRVIALALPLEKIQDAGRFVRRLVGRPPSRNLDLGVPIETTARLTRDRTALIVRPDGRVDRVTTAAAGGEAVLRYPRTDLPGRYSVRVGDGGYVDWFVRPDAAETDTRMVDDSQLAALVGRVTLGTKDTPAGGRSAEPATWLLAAAAVMLGGELLLADRFVRQRGPR